MTRRLGGCCTVAALVVHVAACGPPPTSAHPGESSTPQAAAREERERLDAVVAAEALKHFGAGGTREELARALSGIADHPTAAGRTAKAIQASLSAPRAFDPKPTAPFASDFDMMVMKSATEGLYDERCVTTENGTYPSVRTMISFGYTALDTLEMAKTDRRLSRCVGVPSDDSICSIDPSACPSGPGPALPSVRTVGSLAASALRTLVPSGPPVDRSDLECVEGAGSERTLDGLVQQAVKTDVQARAVALVRFTLGNMRLRLVSMIAEMRPAAGTELRAFLVDEATNGPVLAARMRAAFALRDDKDIRWPPLAAKTIDLALRGDDVIRERERCDRHKVEGELPKMLEKFPKDMLTAMSAGFASYRVPAKVRAIDMVLSTPTPLTAEGAALAAKGAASGARPTACARTPRLPTWSRSTSPRGWASRTRARWPRKRKPSPWKRSWRSAARSWVGRLSLRAQRVWI